MELAVVLVAALGLSCLWSALTGLRGAHRH